MKRLFIPLLLLIGTTVMFSCDEMNENNGKSRVVQDSLVNVLPTWQALKIKVDENNTNMHIVVGDATFYKASDDVKKQKTEELAKMILRIYGPNNYLEKGTLIVTADIKNNSETPADGIAIPIDFKGMKQVINQK